MKKAVEGTKHRLVRWRLRNTIGHRQNLSLTRRRRISLSAQPKISHCEAIYHTTKLYITLYDGGYHASPGSPWAFLPPADGNRLVFFGKTVPIIILCRRRKSGIEINFKKVFTNRFCCDIIPFANARYSGCGVNLFEVITCRILGAEANILMR